MDHASLGEAEKEVPESIMDFFQREQAHTAWGKLFDPDQPWDNEPKRNEGMPTPLYYVSLVGLQCTVELLLQKGADINVQGGRYGNALQAASYQGHQGIVQLLLERGADVNAWGGWYGNAQEITIVQLPLLKIHTNVNAQGGLYGNALQAASSEGHQGIVQLLLEKGARE